MLKKKLMLRTLFVVSAALILTTSNVYAYSLITNGYESPNIRFKIGNLNSTYTTAVIDGAATWNGTPTRATIVKDDNSANLIVGTSVTEDWYGLYEVHVLDVNSKGESTKFTITINGNRFFQDMINGVNIVNSIKSTFAHEFGHALHLADLGGSSNLMSSQRNREVIYTPQQDDINGVNAYWPRS